MIPYYRIQQNKNELNALEEVYSNGNWVVGNATAELENKLKQLFNIKHIVLTSNGYSALFISIKSLGLKNEKIIIPSVSTCFAITNAVITSGNIPIFCDVNLEDGNCDINSVEKIIQLQDTKYIISPNHAGNISYVSSFKKLGLTVIEDACQSFFSSVNISSEADIQVFSFYPTKGINGIDGGVIATNDEVIANKARKLTYYNDQEIFENEERYNFRFLNICAAVVLSNINKQNLIINKLNYVREFYNKIIENCKNISSLQNKKSSTLQRYVIKVIDDITEDNFVQLFKNNKIQLNKFFIWICPEAEKSNFIIAQKLIKSSYCIPYFEDLNNEELKTIESTIINVIKKSHN
jgi:dTDP-4-amino-4,6-dideoxygalactose transaminase